MHDGALYWVGISCTRVRMLNLLYEIYHHVTNSRIFNQYFHDFYVYEGDVILFKILYFPISDALRKLNHILWENKGNETLIKTKKPFSLETFLGPQPLSWGSQLTSIKNRQGTGIVAGEWPKEIIFACPSLAFLTHWRKCWRRAKRISVKVESLERYELMVEWCVVKAFLFCNKC